MIAYIIGLGVLVVILVWLKNNVSASASVVTTGPGVLKVHNVECAFWSEGAGKGVFHGKLSQDRWSDGQERFKLYLHKLPAGLETLRLYQGDTAIADFAVEGSKVRFASKGKVDESKPQFEIGTALEIRSGDFVLRGIVEAD